MNDEPDKLPPPPGGYCPDDLGQQPDATYKDERPYRKGDEARRFRRRRR